MLQFIVRLNVDKDALVMHAVECMGYTLEDAEESIVTILETEFGWVHGAEVESVEEVE